MPQEKYAPLISVGVIAYNSAEYILDLLESVKAQTYQNIELIVADDKSSDDTVKKCNEWISQNKERFVRTEVIVPEQNTGTAGNYNRALFASNGEWMKFIDGDDIMFAAFQQHMLGVDTGTIALVLRSHVTTKRTIVGSVVQSHSEL